MKKTLRTILAGAVALLAVSCYDDSALNGKIDALDQRLTEVEAALDAEVGGIADLLSRIETLEGKVAAIKVETKDGVTTLTLSNESSVVLSKDGVITIKDGNWATVAADGTVTVLPYKVGHDLDFKVENGELKISYDEGKTYEATGVKVSEYTAHVIGNVVPSADGKSVAVTIGDQTLTLPLVSSAVATLGLSQESFFLRYGASKEIKISATNLTDVYVMNQPDGWRASIDGDILTIHTPTKKAVSADAAEGDGLILIHATDNNGKCVVAKLEVTTGEGLTITISDDGKIEIRNAYTSLQVNEMLGTSAFGFSPFWIGIAPAADYYGMINDFGMTFEEAWMQYGGPVVGAYCGNYYNNQVPGEYVEGKYEVDVINTTINDLFYYDMQNYMDLPYGAYVVWVASDNGKGYPADGIVALDYAKIELSVEVVEVLHNDVKVKVTALGADSYIIGGVAQTTYTSGWQPMTFDEYMTNESFMSMGPWATFVQYGYSGNLGQTVDAFPEESFVISQYVGYGDKFNFNESYDFWVMPMFNHLSKMTETGEFDYSAYDYEKNFKPYVQTVTTIDVVAGDVVAPTVEPYSTYSKVGAVITPAEGTSVYATFVDSETLLSLDSDRAKLDYLLENTWSPITTQSDEYTSVNAGESSILLLGVISEDGKYCVAYQTLTALSYPSSVNDALTVTVSEAVVDYTSVSVEVTPATETSAYYMYMDDTALARYETEESLMQYICQYGTMTAETAVAKRTYLSPGNNITLVVLVVDAQNSYKLLKYNYTTTSLPYNSDVKISLVSISEDTTTKTCTVTVKAEGATMVALKAGYANGLASFELNTAEQASYQMKYIEVGEDGTATATLTNFYSSYMYIYATAYNIVDGVVTAIAAEGGVYSPSTN